MAASDRVRITVSGKGGHGAHPDKSIDPVLTLAYILTQIQSVVARNVPPLEAAVITFGKFTKCHSGRSLYGGDCENFPS